MKNTPALRLTLTHIVRISRSVCSVFSFEYYGGFYHLYGVPCALGYLTAITSFRRTKADAFHLA